MGVGISSHGSKYQIFVNSDNEERSSQSDNAISDEEMQQNKGKLLFYSFLKILLVVGIVFGKSLNLQS